MASGVSAGSQQVADACMLACPLGCTASRSASRAAAATLVCRHPRCPLAPGMRAHRVGCPQQPQRTRGAMEHKHCHVAVSQHAELHSAAQQAVLAAAEHRLREAAVGGHGGWQTCLPWAGQEAAGGSRSRECRLGNGVGPPQRLAGTHGRAAHLAQLAVGNALDPHATPLHCSKRAHGCRRGVEGGQAP